MRSIELHNITIKGFKSIKELNSFDPRSLNVFIGQNGAGKSNFIAFFRFLANMLNGTGNLAEYTGMQGGASELLFDGPEMTPHMSASLAIKSLTGLSEYYFRLSHASGDSFIFSEERFRDLSDFKDDSQIPWLDLGAGYKEAGIIRTEAKWDTRLTLKKMLQRLIVYQFHNTTFSSPIRNNKADLENGWFLEEDGKNLAAVLYELGNNQVMIYRKIVDILRLIMPFFDDFNLYPEYNKIYLRWKEKGSEKTFVASHTSDGMLRAMALVTLLCLPQERLPGVMFVDEPELGLHPSAISIISDLFKGVSEFCQVFIATQNADMLNEFAVEDIVVVSRNERESIFKRLNEEELSEWVNDYDYNLATLWNKNIIGGRP